MNKTGACVTLEVMDPGETTLLNYEAGGNPSHHTSQTSLIDTCVAPSQDNQVRSDPQQDCHPDSAPSTTQCARILLVILERVLFKMSSRRAKMKHPLSKSPESLTLKFFPMVIH